MLVIRPSQMHILNQGPAAAFRRTVTAYLNEEFPSLCAARKPAELESFIEEAIGRGERFGLEFEADFCDYIAFLFEHGLNFASDPALGWAREIAEDPQEAPATRVARLVGWSAALRRLQRP